MNDRIKDPRLKAIMDESPPVHITDYLRRFFGIIDPAPFKQLGTREEFLTRYPHEEAKLNSVLAGDRLLDFDLAEKLQEYFGLDDTGLLLRVQGGSYIAKKRR